MRLIFQILQIIFSIILTALILVQSRGTGLSSVFGGELSFYRSKRGLERSLFILTIIFAISFSITSFVGFLLKN